MTEMINMIPETVFYLKNFKVDSYVPKDTKINGAGLIMGLMFALYGNNPYDFEFMAIRKSGQQIFTEPLIYRDPKRLNLKSITADIKRCMDGSFGSVYVQMKEPTSQKSIGISFWNENINRSSFSVVHRVTRGFDEDKLALYMDQVFFAFVNNRDILMRKFEESMK